MSNWQNQSMTEYLFETFCQDKIEHDLQYLMANKENQEKPPGIIANELTTIFYHLSGCETCPLFDGWKDPLGLPMIRCKLCDINLQGGPSMELFNQVHHGHKPSTLTLILEDHE
jgi:hypothetical protein